MPGGVIANNDISWPFTFHILVGMVQKHLKDFAVGMGEFQGIKLAGARTIAFAEKSFLNEGKWVSRESFQGAGFLIVSVPIHDP